jgi:hypothetical protein
MRTIQTTVFGAGGKNTHTLKEVEALVKPYTNVSSNLRIAYVNLLSVEGDVLSEDVLEGGVEAALMLAKESEPPSSRRRGTPFAKRRRPSRSG